MKANFLIFSLTFLIVTTTGNISFGQSSSPTDYFRSKSSGTWNSQNSWESSPNGTTNWIPATLIPSEMANVVSIRFGHSISVNTNTSVDQVEILNGGILELKTVTSTTLTVNDGPGNDLIVQNGGIFKHNVTGSSLPAFVGLASIEIQSGGTLEVANNNAAPSNYAVTNSSIANNIIWADNSIFNWNNTSPPAVGVTYFPATAAIPVFRFSAAASIGGTAATIINGVLEANANVNFLSTGTKTVRNGIIGVGTVSATAVSVGQIIINGTTAKLGGGTLVLSDAGLLISSGTELSLISNKTINKVGTASSPINLSGTMIAGDYLIDGASTIQINGTIKTTNANGLVGNTNTTFATGFGISYFGSNSVVEYNRLGDQIITPLSYANVNIYGSGYKKVIGTSDMGITGTLDLAASTIFTLNGINHLNLNSSSILNINANSIFDNGGESRIKGGLRINILGTFITRSEAGFSGATLSTIAGATASVIITIYDGSVIEFGRAGDQTVISRNDFYNITFSGSGIKTLPTMVPYGTVTIKDDAIVDASNKTFGNENTNLTMTGGRFKVAGLSTKPDIAGIYNLSGGVIEFAGGTASSRQNIRSTPLYLNIEVSGPNVGNSSSSTRIANGGSFTVKTGGSYENSGDKIDGTLGTQTFTIESGGIFKTGVTGGFAGSSTSALYNIENMVVDPRSTIIYSRNGDQTITPLTNCPSLFLRGSGIKTLTNGSLNLAATADSLVIDPLVFLKISSGARADFNNRPIIIHSNTNGSGGIGEITDGANALLNATKVTVERFIPAKRAFRFLTSPVTTLTSIKENWMEKQNNPAPAYSVNNNNYPGYGTHLTGSADANAGFDATATNNPSVFTFNNARQAWETLLNTNSSMTAGYPYRIMVRGSRGVDLSSNAATPSNTILRTTGSLLVGTITFDKKSYPSVSTHTGDYSFVGNPYASAINWDLISKSNVSGYYYVWDPNLNTRGAYAVYGNNITNPVSSAVNQYIQSGQGFFVETTSPNPSITFEENNKAVVNRNVFRSTSTSSIMSIQLLFDTAGVKNVADGITVMFDESYSTQIGSEDALKFKNLDENMSIESNEKLLSIEGRPTVIITDSVQVSITDFRQKQYYLKVNTESWPEGVNVIIKDHFLKKEIPVKLNGETITPFAITNDSASFNPERFIVILRAAKALPITTSTLKAYKKEAGILLSWQVETENGIEKYEVEKSTDGERFSKIAEIVCSHSGSKSVNYSWLDNNVKNENNFYRIKYVTKSGTSEYSNRVVMMTDLPKSDLTIFPNPVTGNVFYVTAKNSESSPFLLSIYSDAGQKIYSTTIRNNGNLTSYKISIGQVIPKGSYRLQITNRNKNYCERLVFQ